MCRMLQHVECKQYKLETPRTQTAQRKLTHLYCYVRIHARVQHTLKYLSGQQFRNEKQRRNTDFMTYFSLTRDT
jgi:hypothetical protein